MKKRLLFLFVILSLSGLILLSFRISNKSGMHPDLEKLEKSFQLLKRQFPDQYDLDNRWRQELNGFKKQWPEIKELNSAANQQFLEQLRDFKQKILLANPLIANQSLIYIRRESTDFQNKKVGLADRFRSYGFASNHECKSSMKRSGWNNEMVTMDPEGNVKILFRPEKQGFVGEMDLHWEADRLLFTESNPINWKVKELDLNLLNSRDVTHTSNEIHTFDACYLPNGKVVFNSTAMFQSIPCWHGVRLVANLYSANGDGSGMRRLCFDQDHNFHPTVMNNGQVMYHRWDYTGINHVFQRQIMAMNPDGTGQRAIYGTNTYFPNALYHPQAIPGANQKFVSILTGYHDPHKSGWLVLTDLTKGYRKLDGITHRISGTGAPLKEIIDDGAIQGTWPLFTTPFPLSEEFFLVSRLIHPDSTWEICLADIYDNIVVIKKESGFHLLEPIPRKKRIIPPVIPDKIDPETNEGTVYLQNVYTGPGMEGVPHGIVDRLRVFAYNFGFYGLAGPHKIGFGGPWEAMQILGTTPVEADGSAFFKVPANTPIAFQPLDTAGQAIQLMRSWVSVMPGEVRSCVGCHESPSTIPPAKPSLTARQLPRRLDDWYGPARGFDFEREIQPVLDHYCVDCHDGVGGALPDLRSEVHFPQYMGQTISHLGIDRMHPEMKKAWGEKVKYTPAYDALVPYIKRVGVEDDAELLTPGEHYASNSELIQIINKGHYGVNLNQEAKDRLITWIDLNAPCHGTWGDVFPIPDSSYEKRRKYARLYQDLSNDPEQIPDLARPTFPPARFDDKPKSNFDLVNKLPGSVEMPITRQQEEIESNRMVDLSEGVTLTLINIPSGKFLMGSEHGSWDELPVNIVTIEQSFWMGATEITNGQYRLYKPDHNSKYFAHRHERQGDKGIDLNQRDQPVLRVSWHEAMSYCQWLTDRSDLEFSLPTEAEWEYACKAGSHQTFWFGEIESDFSGQANLGDLTFSQGKMKGGPYREVGFQVTGGVTHFNMFGAGLANTRFNDKGRATVKVGSYGANPWGLYDMHGNVAEWTLSNYKKYPYDSQDGRNEIKNELTKVVRGGSYTDRPKRSTSAYRLAYPSWQHVYNVGFRVVAKEKNSNFRQ